MTATADALRYIADSTHWLAHHQEAEQAFDELEHICALVDTAIDAPAALMYAGPCDVCRRDMYAEQGAEEVECKLCHLAYPMEARREWLLEQVADRLETASVLASALADLGENIKADTIRNWADKGRLHARGRDHRGRALYKVEDVRELAKTMKRRDSGRMGA